MPSIFDQLPNDWQSKTDRYSQLIRNWTTTPNYKQVPRRDLPINPYKHQLAKLNQSFFAGAKMVYGDGTSSYLSGYEPGYLYEGRSIDLEWRQRLLDDGAWAQQSSDLEQDLKMRLLLKISDMKVNTGLLAAEAAKTAKTVEGLAEQVYSGVMAARRGNFKAAARILGFKPRTGQDSAKRWLEAKYGITPILLDAKGAAELFAQQFAFNGRPPYQKVTVSGETAMSRSATATLGVWGGAPGQTFIRSITARAKQHRSMSAWIEVSSQSLTAAQQAGLTNPALVAWELVPWSFVFDWFVSVGSYLQAMTALHGLRVVKTMDHGYNTYVYVRDDPETHGVQGSTHYYNGRYHVEADVRDYFRGPISDFGAVPIPRLKNPLSSFDRLVTSLSLIRGRFR